VISNVPKPYSDQRILDLFFKDSHTCFVLLDKDFNFIRVNEAYASADGKPVDFFPGKNHFELYPSEAIKIFREVKKSKKPFSISARPFVYPDAPERGITFWDWSLDPLLDDDGEVEFFVFSLNNVTDRVRAEKERDRFINLSANMMCTLTHRGEFVDFSPAWHKILGYNKDQLKGTPLFKFVHEEDEEKARQKICEISAGGVTENFLIRFKTLNNRTRYLSWNAASDDQTNLIYAVVHDITFIKKSEIELEKHRNELERLVELRTNELRNNQTRLSHLLSSSPAVIYTCEPQGDFGATYISENIKPLFGYDPEQFTNEPSFWASNIHPEDSGKIFGNLTKLFEHGHHTHEYRFRKSDGTYMWVHDELRLIYNEDGTPKEIIGYWADIDDRKQVEQELLLAKAQAENANKSKSIFLSKMSHELRTPMNAILGFSQLLELSDMDDENRQNVREILKAGRHLLELINDVLDLSRIEAGRVPISMENISLNRILEDCFTLISPLAHTLNIKVIDNITEQSLFIVWADYTRFKQVLVNLLTNAIKYNNPNGDITLFVEQIPDHKIRISIKDTGKGISVDQAINLFKPFERLGAESTEVEGTGIGLVVTKQLVELMGGSIGFDSKPGEGSVFWVDIQLGDSISQSNRLAPFRKTTFSDLITSTDEKTKSILYVEDNPANLRLVNKIISNTPYNLLSTHSGTLGVELAEAHKPDLILLDINLPEMNGYEVLSKLKENKNLSSIPVVAISANAMTRDVEKGLEAGFDHYIKKPIDIKEFLKTIESLI